jgi:hypothetical protein
MEGVVWAIQTQTTLSSINRYGMKICMPIGYNLENSYQIETDHTPRDIISKGVQVIWISFVD